MSKHSRRKKATGRATSSAEASPANQSASRAREKAPLIIGGSGPSLLASFAYYDLAMSCWRTSQGFSVKGWDSFSGTWPQAGMMRNGKVYRLRRLVPRISGNASSSSLLPTPWALEIAEAEMGRMNERGRMVRKSGEDFGLNLSTMAKFGMLPTPRSSPNENRQTKLTPSQKKGKHGLSLCAVMNLPTPRASDAERGGRGELLHVVKGAKTPRGKLPTPTASPWRSGKGKTQQERGRTAGPSLSEVSGGQLNPEFVEWLMGFPRGWTALDA